jgi:hypothetical protein
MQGSYGDIPTQNGVPMFTSAPVCTEGLPFFVPSLFARQNEAVRLRNDQHCSIARIGELMGVTARAVFYLLARARRRGLGVWTPPLPSHGRHIQGGDSLGNL